MCDGAARHAAGALAQPARRRPLLVGRRRPSGPADRAGEAERHPRLRSVALLVARVPGRRPGHDGSRHPPVGAAIPSALDVQVEYRVDDAGLVVTTTATNVGDARCPTPTGSTRTCRRATACSTTARSSSAATRVDTDAERQLPVGDVNRWRGRRTTSPPAEPSATFAMDFAFTDVARDEAGRAWVSLGRPDGSRAEIWVDETYPYVELYTGDTLAPDRRRRGLGTEPMTCPPERVRDRGAADPARAGRRRPPGPGAHGSRCRCIAVPGLVTLQVGRVSIDRRRSGAVLGERDGGTESTIKMDIDLPAEDDPRRLEVRRWFEEHPTPSAKELVEAGYVVPHWPKPYGLDADPELQLIIADEMRRAGVAKPINPIGIGHCGPILVALGVRRAEGPLPLADAHGRGDVVPAVQRAGRRLRPRQPEHTRRSATATSTW